MYYFFVVGKMLVLLLPRSASYAVAKFLATVQFYVSRKDRDAVFYNLSPIVSDSKQVRTYAKHVFINFSYYLVDFFRYSKLNEKFIKKYVRVSGRRHLDEALSHGRGIILASAHLGSYELGGAVIALLGYPFHVIALPHTDERLTRFFIAQRTRAGLKVVSTGATVKRCYSLLKKGEIVGILGDRDFAHEGLEVSLFSRRAKLPRGTAFFALKTGAVIIPTFFVRENKKHYHLIIEKPLEYNKDDSNAEETIIKTYASLLEKYIAQYPDQWYVFQKYWL